MTSRPRAALAVTDVSVSLAFYTTYLGFTMSESPPVAGTAVIIDSDGDPILLITSGAGDIKSYLDEPRIVFKPGDTLDYSSDDIDAQRSKLVERGFSEVTVEENGWGDRKLALKDPDGYIVAFIQAAKRSPEEIVRLYEQGPDELEKALAGLSEADIDLRRASNEWTIRQTVHHLAESASIFLMMIKSALAQSGSVFVRSPYDQDHWVQALDYNGRAIEPSVALVKAVHAHIAQLLHHIPDYWDRYVMMKYADEPPESEGRKLTVGQVLSILSRHTVEHCEEIWQTRRVHNI